MNLEKPISILVRRRAALGDVIVATGIPRELKKLYGDNCIVDVVSEYPQVWKHNPHVRQSFHTDHPLRIEQYDVYYNLDDTYEFNPNNHFADNYFYRIFGTTDMDRSMELYVDDTESQSIDDFVSSINGDFIAVHMRRWYWEMKNIDAVVWVDVFNKILAQHPSLKLVCVGGDTDFYPEGSPNVIDGRSLGTPGILSGVLDHAKCFVGIDSAPFHIAGTSSTGIVALMSHMKPSNVLPYREGVLGHNCEVVQASVDCVECHGRQARPVRQIKCERGDYACNKLWDTDAIVSAINKFL